MTTFLGIPLNRILTIGRGPINVVSASLATWLIVHVHILGLAHVQHDGLATGIAQGIVWVVTAVLTDRSIAQWVSGHHIQLHGASIERPKLLESSVGFAEGLSARLLPERPVSADPVPDGVLKLGD